MRCHGIHLLKIITQDLAPIRIVGCRDGVIRAAVKTPSRLPQTHKRFCNASCWSFRPLAATDVERPGKTVYVRTIGSVEGRMKTLCLLLTSLHKHNETLFEPGEPTHKTDCKIVASDQLARCYNRAITQVKRVIFEDVRNIRIRLRRIDGAQVPKQLNISDIKQHPCLVEHRVRIVELKFPNETPH